MKRRGLGAASLEQFARAHGQAPQPPSSLPTLTESVQKSQCPHTKFHACCRNHTWGFEFNCNCIRVDPRSKCRGFPTANVSPITFSPPVNRLPAAIVKPSEPDSSNRQHPTSNLSMLRDLLPSHARRRDHQQATEAPVPSSAR